MRSNPLPALRTSGWSLIGLVACAVGSTLTARGAEGTVPVKLLNVVLILVDDLGWTDLSCQGSRFYETPHIDRLAAEGMRFAQGYSACTVCSPTRAAVLTGKYPARLHITDWIPGHVRTDVPLRVPDWMMHLPLEETTLAERFRAAGYATAHVGKWHLGGQEYWPTHQGFDLNIGGNDRGQPPSYFFPYERGGQNPIRLPGLEQGNDGEYLTDRLTDESLAFIERNRERPFLLYWPHYAVHTPLQAKPSLVEKYRAKADPKQPQHHATYAAMIESLDESVGRLMRALREWQIDDRTLVVFTSDNGGLTLNQITSNVPLRAGKGSAYEGGVRVPLIFRCPGTVAVGTSDTPAMSIDLLPTLVELSGVSSGRDTTIDGMSLASHLRGAGPVARDALYWHYPHYHPGGATPYGAVRSGDWKLIEFYEDQHIELYNLREDLSEERDRAAELPEKAAALRQQLHQWREQVGAQMPTAG